MNILLKQHLRPEIDFHTKMLNEDVSRLGRKISLEAMNLTTQEIWNSCFKFAFVRNPWDRAVSMYEHLCQSYRAFRETEGFKMIDKVEYMNAILEKLNITVDKFTFRIFVEAILRDRAFDNYHWDKQLNCITDEKGTVMMNYVGRFESLQPDFNHVCSRLGIAELKLPHLNKSAHAHYSTYYDASLINLIGDIYAEDIACFNYDFV